MSLDKPIKDIHKEYKDTNIDFLPSFIEQYIKDGRPGVSKIISQAQKRLMKIEDEKRRIRTMQTFDMECGDNKMVCGIDEVGRGPLAGSVVAAAVILPKDCDILYINDSKKLSAQKREELYLRITKEAISFGLGEASPEKIDEINILQATYLAMRRAIENLSVTPEVLLNDAVTIPKVDIKQVPIVKGDAKSYSIAAASIVAKVTRDRQMVEYDAIYPQYHFADNKGYGTKEHILALKKYGPSPIHRMSFIKNFL